MARSKALAELTDNDLVEQLDETRTELFNLRFQHATGQLDNSSRLGAVRRDVARLRTELRRREIDAAEAAVTATTATAQESS